MSLEYGIRALVLGVLLALFFAWLFVVAQSESYTLVTGPIAQTENQEQTCTATIGYGVGSWILIGPPNAESCYRLRELDGRSVRLHVEIDP